MGAIKLNLGMKNDINKSRIIDILFESFYYNKSVNFVVKQDAKKDKRLRILMEYSYFVGENFGKIYLNKDKSACAILIDPSKKRTTFKSVLWDIKLLIFCIGISNLSKVMKRESEIKNNHPKINFIHLWYIGVSQNDQGKGIGTLLMKEIIDDYHKKEQPIYLETSTIRNFPFYERLGFEKVAEIESLGYPLKMYIKS